MRPALIAFSIAVILSDCRAAFVIIDNFDNPTPGTFFRVNPPAGPSVNPVVLVDPTGLGSTRTATMQVDVPNPLPPGTTALTGTLGDGVLDFNSNTFANARATLQYSGFTGNSANFFQGGVPTFLYLNFVSLDPGIDVGTNAPAATMPVDIAISTAGGTVSGSFLFPSTPGNVEYQIPISSLSGIADFTQVQTVTFVFNGGPNQRQRADFVVGGITYETVPVPLPPTVLLGLLGLPTIAYLRRRK
jgi:hypothetical protein